MMKRSQLMSRFVHAAGAVLFLGALAMAQTADAVGWGPVVKYGFTKGTITEVDDEDDIDVRLNGFDIGLVYDTNVAADRVFNYRLEVAFEYGNDEWRTAYVPSGEVPLGNVDFNTYGVSLNNTFGFGLLRSRVARLYVGPSVRLAVLGGSGTPDFKAGEIDVVQVDFGVGPEVGLNFHLGDNVSLSTTLAYHAQMTFAGVDDPNRPYAGGQTDYGYVGFTNHLWAGVAVLFRSAGDIFR